MIGCAGHASRESWKVKAYLHPELILGPRAMPLRPNEAHICHQTGVAPDRYWSGLDGIALILCIAREVDRGSTKCTLKRTCAFAIDLLSTCCD